MNNLVKRHLSQVINATQLLLICLAIDAQSIFQRELTTSKSEKLIARFVTLTSRTSVTVTENGMALPNLTHLISASSQICAHMNYMKKYVGYLFYLFSFFN